MPRKGKGSKRKKPRNTGRDVSVARYWRERIEAGIEGRRDYMKRARFTLDSLQSKHSMTFNGEIREQFVDFSQGGSMVSIPKPAQVQASLAPHLNMGEPHRRVVAKSGDTVIVALSRVLQAYLNYTAKEAELGEQTRRATTDAIVRGRGFGHTLWDDTLEIVTSIYRSSKDVIIDPDVEHIDDAMWIAWREVQPVWVVKRRVKERSKRDVWRLEDLKANIARDDKQYSNEDDSTVRRAPLSNDLVEIWHVYSRMGSGLRGASFPEGEDYSRYDDSEDYVLLEIVKNHDLPLFEGDWDIPLYLDKAWPLEGFDLVDSLDVLWPESVESLAGPLQVAIDQTASIIMTAVKNRGRTIMLGDSTLPTEAQQRVKVGGMSEFISVPMDGAQSAQALKNRFHVVELGAVNPASMQWLDWLTTEYETTTGVTPSLSGAPTTGAEDRSATKTRQRGEAANARVNDWRRKAKKWGAKLARNEAIYARLALTYKEIDPYVETTQIAMFFPRIEKPDGKILPLRDFGGKLSVMRLQPEAAQFFPDPQSAAMALMSLWEEMQTSEEFEVVQLLSELGQGEQGMPPSGLSVAPVTVEDVWRETSGITAKEVMREFGYEVGSGSMENLDKEAETEMLGNLMQTIMPPALQSGQLDIVNHLMQSYYRVHEVPEEDRAPPFQAPQPPPGQEQGGPPQEAAA